MGTNGPEIGDMYEGIIEGGEDASYTENIFTCKKGQICQSAVLDVAYLRGPGDREICSRSQDGQPSSSVAFCG